ncbi:DUF1203 domain-containing protein [Micromonospora sp. RTGN7]|uniref:DUF1203 domain-containing protein n=1 Tax=Micromonospora sp. RTGN7 TaxID=3016526 RepID=UPI0029FECE2E|nr:DUF1203 domain-containing protein [Micromonospora sp. RTGN7]
MTTTPNFRVRALPPEVPAAVRAAGRDASGLPPHRSTATGGEPLRCCLRDATTGEEIMLFGYAPPIPAGPYREVGPVFAHAGPCAGPSAGYPPAWRGRAQVLRAYDRRGWIHDARVHDGADPEAVIAELLTDPAVERLHSRNVAYGCFMFTVDRPG